MFVLIAEIKINGIHIKNEYFILYLLLKINDTIPEHFEIERKNNKSLISYRVFRKK